MIRDMRETDWNGIKAIYEQGLSKGQSTFNTVCPEYEDWNQNHIHECRYVAEIDGKIVGWITISQTSSREAYKGVVEVSVYVDERYQGIGIGTELLQKMCIESKRCGYWCLYSAIISSNLPSIKLHQKCGFREIGFRERIAQDRFGNWQNTTLMERRF